MPEGLIPLAQGVTYLAERAQIQRLVSRDAGGARGRARARRVAGAAASAQRADRPDAQTRLRRRTIAIRTIIDGALVEQSYLPDKLEDAIYYFPSERGYEARIREFLERVRKSRLQKPPPDKGSHD